ncbi:hypothetical protein Bca4012_065776 [Brassica carinata]
MRGGSDDEEEEGSQAGCSIGSVTSMWAPAGEEAGMRRIRWFCLRGKSLGRSFEKKSRGSTSFEREIDGECCVQEGLQKLKQYSTIMEVDDERRSWITGLGRKIFSHNVTLAGRNNVRLLEKKRGGFDPYIDFSCANIASEFTAKSTNGVHIPYDYDPLKMHFYQKFWEDSNVKKCGELMGVDMLILDRKSMMQYLRLYEMIMGVFRLALEKNEWGMMQEVLVHQMASSLAKD